MGRPDGATEMAGEGPITLATPARFRDPLPEAVDVAIIGGGVAGVFTALEAARLGLSVVVLEKGRVAGEQSSRNWGWIRTQGREGAELPLMLEAMRSWERIAQRADIGFRRAGITYLASSPERMAVLDGHRETSRAHGIDTDALSACEVAQTFGPAGGWVGGILTPGDARAEPWRAVPIVAAIAREAGALIREGCAVRALDVAGGRVTGVLTEDGRVRAERVVLAGGAWSALLARRHGFTLAQLAVRNTAARTGPLPAILEGAASDETLAIRRRDDGGYTLALRDRNEHFVGPDSFRLMGRFRAMLRHVGRDTSIRLRGRPDGDPNGWTVPTRWDADAPSPFERARVLDPAPNAALVRGMAEAFATRFPALGRPAITHAWAGMIDTTPDELPLLGPAPGLEGLIVATGLSGHGFGIGPAIGAVAARLAGARDPGHDLGAFRVGRA